MMEAYLLLGSNEGDRISALQTAMELIVKKCGLVIHQSSVYETAAWGLEDQPDFLNQVIAIRTTQTPDQLLSSVQQIEAELGRQRAIKWGQRTIDIDILFLDDLIINQPDLKVPHPFIQERKFTLLPLVEIAAEKHHPTLNLTIKELLKRCTDPLPVKKLPSAPLADKPGTK